MIISRCHHLLPVPRIGSVQPIGKHTAVDPKLEIRHKNFSVGEGNSQFHAAICRAQNAAPTLVQAITPINQADLPRNTEM